MASGKSCLRQAGEICKDNPECCTGACRPSSDGAERCAYVGGCHQQCEICTDGASCCSGICEPDNTGVLRCAPPATPDCIATGEICAGGDCCPKGPTGICDEVSPMLPPKRCLGLGNPKGAGEPCALPGDCESGVCAPAATAALECASACLDEGAPCTARTDCCAPLTHDCMPVGGPPTCVELIH